MIYIGKAVTLNRDAKGIAELVLDLENESVNKLNRLTLSELKEAVRVLKKEDGINGLLLRSAKPDFIVGADISEFSNIFDMEEAELSANLRGTHQLFLDIENLPYPTVTAINGMALGGGFELCLSTDYRVSAIDVKVGLPEVSLGIFPGWGGCVRLPRLSGLKTALEWIVGAKPQKAEAASKAGVIDLVVDAPELLNSARNMLLKAIYSGEEYLQKRQCKRTPLSLNQADSEAVEQILSKARKIYGANYPAPAVVIDLVQEIATIDYEKALEREVECFPTLAKGSVSRSLVGLFLNDQLLKKKAKAAQQKARPVAKAAVLGAGIMGGGVAYQSASTGTPIMMKDINFEALDLGIREADKQLSKLVDKKRIDAGAKAQILEAIEPTLSYDHFADVDLVVEAVVENPKVKASVLAEVESQLYDGAILTSNTSTISITSLAKSLKNPEQFCGMHFFNPVPLMPLVEVIRGEKSSEEAVATTVAYARSMGKTPIVVNDCPGFLVNRILFPYFNGFNLLLQDGVDFQRIDRVMEAFGWPMGPAYLLDVVGIDTAVHADAVMVEGFPERMGHEGQSVIEALVEQQRFGQKNGRGFYHYGVDAHGRRTKEAAPEAYALIQSLQTDTKEVSDAEIIERLMIPLCLEAVRCLEEGIAESAAEVDMGLVLGLGFPRFRGGPLRYVDHQGLAEFCALVEKHQSLGPLYRITEGLKSRAANNKRFFG